MSRAGLTGPWDLRHPLRRLAGCINLLLALCWKCIGLVVLSAAAPSPGSFPPPRRRASLAMFTGTGLIAILTSLAVVQAFAVNPWSASRSSPGLATIVGFIPPCAGAPGSSRS